MMPRRGASLNSARFSPNSMFRSKKIIATALKTYEKDLKDASITLEPSTVASLISKAKARGLSASDFLADAVAKARHRGPPPPGSKHPISSEVIVGEVYTTYEATLRRDGALDFDDLLVYGVKLFQGHPSTVDWCDHILVDELCVSLCYASRLARLRMRAARIRMSCNTT